MSLQMESGKATLALNSATILCRQDRRQGVSTCLVAVVLVLLISLVSIVSQAQTLTPLYTFSGSDGGNPIGALVMDPFGNLYGTTETGGLTNNGTIFSLIKAGSSYTFHSMYSFNELPDGSGPDGALLRDGLGNLYGTTQIGGSGNLGTVFEFSAAGIESILHNFQGNPDGAKSYSPLSQDYSAARGSLYGTTEYGGTGNGENGLGTVFKLNPNTDNVTIVHAFTGPDGAEPTFAGVIRDASGNLYGTTFGGGQYGLGVAFKMNGSGTILWEHSFSGTPDGAHPWASLVTDSVGNLYGTTADGGTTNLGTVFVLDSAGNETVLYSFSGTPDGRYPYSPLLLDTDGNLYGTTQHGGALDAGSVYKINSQHQECILWSFTAHSDGEYPYGGVVMDTSGNLYGTSVNGGNQSNDCLPANFGCGAVFMLSPPYPC